MTKLPILKGEEIVKLLQRLGFEIIRQKGSHIFLRHSDGRKTVVPVHKGQDIDRGLLRKIIRDVELSYQEFSELVQRQNRKR